MTMLSAQEIEQLEAFDAQGARVLSVYLRLDPAQQVRRAYMIALEDMVKEARDRAEEPGRTELANEAEQVRTWLESEEPRGRGLAVFSCTRRDLWQAHFLAVPVNNHLVFEPRPDVAPLLEILDEFERYAVAVIDKGQARLFSVFAGEIEERGVFDDLVLGKHDEGGLSQARFQRHQEAHVYWHVKKVAQRLAELHRRRPFDRLILAGPDEATAALRHVLPRVLARRVVAVVPAEIFANDRQILDKTLEIERQVEREAEERVLAQLIEQAGPTGRATLGVAPTLAALWSDVVQTLVLSHDVHMTGSECPNCGRLDAGELKNCPTCGHAMRPVHDLVHRAMERAMEQAARVEVMHGAAARRLVELGDGLGALLRYPAAKTATAAAS